jgi:tripartite-type tricarboxylate transporter receptor subunit TctC
MEVVRAAPDGYTLLAVSASPIVITPAVQHVAYDPRRDFTFIANYAGAFDGILVPARSPWRSLDDLIVAARATPDTLTYATSGVNGAGHPAVMVLAQRAALRMEHIPYTGGAPVLTALLSAQVSFAVLSNFSEQVHRGDFRLLAVIQDERMPEFPDVPALAERSGALATPHVMGIAAPAGLPAAERATLTAAFVDAANSSEFATRLERLGMPLRVRDGVAMQRQILESFDRYRAAVRELTLRAT